MELSLQALAERFGGEIVYPGEAYNIKFSSINTDTRAINHGDVFVALKGPNFDGHNYLDVATRKGAAAAIVETPNTNLDLPQWCVSDSYKALGELGLASREKFKGKVIGVTGSCGKTTVKGMLAAICSLAGSTVATRGNLNNHIGVPLSLMRLANEHQFAVIEAGTSGPNEIKYLAELIQPHVAIVNNIMPVHVEGFGSVEAIAIDKAHLYRGLVAGGVGVLNVASAQQPTLLDALQGKKITRFNPELTDEAADVRVQNIKQDTFGRAEFSAIIEGEEVELKLGVLGAHNVANALAAASAARAVGIRVELIKRGLEKYTGDKGRMQLARVNEKLTVIDDTYNASPGSVKAAIDYVAQFERSAIVLGDMGELGEMRNSAHEEIGRYAQQKQIKQLWCTGEASRFTAQGYGPHAKWFEDKEQLKQALPMLCSSEVVVLVKGSRSTRMEQIVNALLASGEQK